MTVMQFFNNSAIGTGDIKNGRRIPQGDVVETLIVTSLFTDAYAANDDDLPDGITDRHGCWSDVFHNGQRGSLLWTLRREKITPKNLLRARDICVDALQWLLENHIDSLDVQVEKIGSHRAGILVRYSKDQEQRTYRTELDTNAI